MQTDSIASNSVTHLHSESIIPHAGNEGIAASTTDLVIEPEPAKRPTRQWAAWTREEEESFFTALRQVGKNFQKITCHVQSKNKDQVRHYYYRLVRRMNKLLAPGLCLDAKNSKDTNAAMLRWWSLLEKYSCKASKLHLKPRRFKIFVEALEHQLLKDRKKNVRKRPLQGENCPPPMPNAVANQNRTLGHDVRAVKSVLVDTQNIPKLGPRKTTSKRNGNVGINRGNNGGYPTALKPSRQRRKSDGGVSSAAYKKWEKAAIAGVSLVADAAEHLERTVTSRDALNDQNKLGKKNSDPAENPLLLLPPLQPSFLIDVANAKLKLQLFPVDDGTRRALELDKHNPHLELTLSIRKKISSVLEHLSRKWGNSSAAHGELMLFPYSIQKKSLVDCHRWTQDSFESAGDVYATIGKPQVFRLRYGWCSDTEHGSCESPTSVPAYCIQDDHIVDAGDIEGRDLASINTQHVDLNNDDVGTLDKNMSTPTVPCETEMYISAQPNDDLPRSSDPALNMPLDKKNVADRTITQRSDDVDDLKLSNGASLSAGEWADSLTNISIGDLLSGVSQGMDLNCMDRHSEGTHCLQQIPFSCDSFDAAIAAHISKQQDKTVSQPTMVSLSSIWDAEETCDAFSFQKNPVIFQEVPCSSPFSAFRGFKPFARTNSMGSSHMTEELLRSGSPTEDHIREDPMDECQSDPQISETEDLNVISETEDLNVISETEDLNELADIYWPDSLGPLDLDLPLTNKYHNEDIILGDSLGSLNRLIASSLDAFQNCSFFGFDKKESPAFNS